MGEGTKKGGTSSPPSGEEDLLLEDSAEDNLMEADLQLEDAMGGDPSKGCLKLSSELPRPDPELLPLSDIDNDLFAKRKGRRRATDLAREQMGVLKE